ncbi:MAG: hypothetical protein HKN01_03315 [Acidimicrobiia bacterium]|nr:hypothetical protein [Acidimicrobiia bacterium]
MHFSRWIILVAAATCAVSLGLTFLDTPTGSTNGIDGDAWPILFFLALPVLLALVGDRAEGMRPFLALVTIVSAALAALFAVTKVVDAVRAADTAVSIAGSGSVGTGAWVLLGATVALLGGAAATLSRRVAGG